MFGKESQMSKLTARVVSAAAVFVGLAVIFAVFVILARFVYVDDTFMRTTLITVGSAIFGAGLTFFLIEMFSLEGLRGKATEYEQRRELEPIAR
jgi:steroid 5-alpha reductase family enzyme